MITKHLLASLTAVCVFAAAGVSSANAETGSSTESAKPQYSTGDTDIGTLLDNPATKAVLDKHVPALAANPQIAMARAMTLRQIQGFASDMLTDEILASIDTDLAKISSGS